MIIENRRMVVENTITKSHQNEMKVSTFGQCKCPEMDTLFYAVADYQAVTSLARFWHIIRKTK